MKYLRAAKSFYIACGILLCAIGIVLICMPTISAVILCILLGAISLVYGAEKIIGYFSRDLYRLAFQFDLALGIFVSIIGVILLLRPGRVVELLDFIVGLFVLIEGVFKVQTSVDAYRFGMKAWWLILVGALISGLFGLLLLFDVIPGTQLVMIFVGMSLLSDGAQNLFNAFYTIRVMRLMPRDSSACPEDDDHEEL